MHILRRILGVIFSSFCSCNKSALGDSGIPHFCSSCWMDFALLTGPVCPCCGSPIGSPETFLQTPEYECSACRNRPPMFDQALSIGYYKGPVREAIHQFRCRPCRSLGRPLGDGMVKQVRMISDIDLIMVPLRASRLRHRGFIRCCSLLNGWEAHTIFRSYMITWYARDRRDR